VHPTAEQSPLRQIGPTATARLPVSGNGEKNRNGQRQECRFIRSEKGSSHVICLAEEFVVSSGAGLAGVFLVLLLGVAFVLWSLIDSLGPPR
jgi:hypothetical protein